jgi:hypothetical protein
MNHYATLSQGTFPRKKFDSLGPKLGSNHAMCLIHMALTFAIYEFKPKFSLHFVTTERQATSQTCGSESEGEALVNQHYCKRLISILFFREPQQIPDTVCSFRCRGLTLLLELQTALSAYRILQYKRNPFFYWFKDISCYILTDKQTNSL